jgi:hypothetical protein
MPEEGGVMFRISLLTTAVVLAAGANAFAQQFPSQPPPVKNSTLQQGTAKERDACQPDVSRFCKTQLEVNPNDVLGILNCLQTNRTKISHACQEVLASHGQ